MQKMGRRNIIWRTPNITADGLKIYAGVAMLIQTIGITIVENGMIHVDQYTQAEFDHALATDSHLMVLAGIGSVMEIIGGLAVPVFAFLLVEGFMRTSSYRKYLFFMVVFALLSEIPYDLANSQRFFDWSSQNALVTMCISLLMLYFIKMFQAHKGVLYVALRCIIVLCAVAWVTILRAQYGLCIVLLAAVFYIFYTRNVLKIVLGILFSLLYVTGPLSFYVIWCYNEKRQDKVSKYVYYIIYPLHLLVLGVIGKYFL